MDFCCSSTPRRATSDVVTGGVFGGAGWMSRPGHATRRPASRRQGVFESMELYLKLKTVGGPKEGAVGSQVGCLILVSSFYTTSGRSRRVKTLIFAVDTSVLKGQVGTRMYESSCQSHQKHIDHTLGESVCPRGKHCFVSTASSCLLQDPACFSFFFFSWLFF